LQLYQSFIFLQTQNKTEIQLSMYAIVSIAGQQFKVEKGKKVFVHKLPGEIGDEVSFDKILLIGHDDKVDVGAPYLPDAVVYAQIVSQLRGDKVLVFKKKRRKGYQKLNGHRQYFTEIIIEDIAEAGAHRKTEKKKAVEPKAEVAAAVAVIPEKTVKAEKTTAAKAAPKKAAPKASAEVKPEKAAPKKAAPKKAAETTVKKPAAKKPAAKSEGKSSKK
jgi:large subunit ribosomal protein L21